MNPTRRGVLIGSISSLLLLSTISLAYIDPNREDYYTEPGRYNIWQVQDNQWKLMVDSSGSPLEFSSTDDALDYCEAYNIPLHDHPCHWDYVENKEGISLIRPAPTAPHPKGMLNLSANEADNLMLDWDFTDEQIELIRPMLMAKDGAEQSKAWLDILDIPAKKKLVLSLQKSKQFGKLIRTLYIGVGDPRQNTYHMTLAKLSTFYRLV